MISQVRYELKKVLLSYEFWIAFLLSAFLVNASFIYQDAKDMFDSLAEAYFGENLENSIALVKEAMKH